MPVTAPFQHEYRLADHVRACNVDGQVILLDLQRDKYIGVGGPLLSALSGRISDWPLVEPRVREKVIAGEIERWILTMHTQGMLTPASATPPVRASVAEPLRNLFACEQPPWDGVQWRRMVHIASATLVVGRWLKRRRLDAIAAQVEGRRPVSLAASFGANETHLQSAVSWYLRTRPFLMTSHDECLRDSLTLVDFLAAEHLYPRWVIGVRTRPFTAHSWVQEGNLVLNDLHENVRRYTPILVV